MSSDELRLLFYDFERFIRKLFTARTARVVYWTKGDVSRREYLIFVGRDDAELLDLGIVGYDLKFFWELDLCLRRSFIRLGGLWLI